MAEPALVSSELSPAIANGGGLQFDDQTRIERLVLDPSTPVHVAARVAYDPARTEPIVEPLMCVAVNPEHWYIEESFRQLVDEGA